MKALYKINESKSKVEKAYYYIRWYLEDNPILSPNIHQSYIFSYYENENWFWDFPYDKLKLKEKDLDSKYSGCVFMGNINLKQISKSEIEPFIKNLKLDKKLISYKIKDIFYIFNDNKWEIYFMIPK